MPSSRRVRVYSIFAAVLFLGFFYFSGSTSRSDRAFYDRSLAGMGHSRDGSVKAAPNTAPSPRIPPPAPDSKEALNAKAGAEEEYNDDGLSAAAGRQPPQVAFGEDSDSKRVKGSDGWRTGKAGAKASVNEEKTDEEHKIEAELNSILKRSPIIIFSKSYCPFSHKAKQIFGMYSITPSPFIVELDKHELGPELQAQLHKLTGRRTVPNILISGTTIGGGDEVGMLHEKGELVKTIKDIGGKRIMEARLKGVKEKD